MTPEHEKNFKRCVENICKNLEHPAIHMDSIVKDHGFSQYIVSLMLLTTTHMQFDDVEIANQKDYRQLRNLVRARLIVTILDVKTLAEESLLKLGYK